MSLVDWLSAVLLVAGAIFFLAGTVGMLRFPDALARLHALAKADNLGLGFVCVALALQAAATATAAKLLLIWILALVASATSSHLIARSITRPTHNERDGGNA